MSSIRQSLASRELQDMALDSFGSYFEHGLENTGHTVTSLTKSLYFK